MTVRVECDSKGIVIAADFRDKELCKMVPGARWDAELKIWRVPLSWSSCKALRGVFKDRLEIGPDLQAWAQEVRVNYIDPLLRLRLELDDEWVGGYEPRLFPFQRAGVAWLTLAMRALLADEMGTGKTVQTIVALRLAHKLGRLPEGPIAIICPNAMKRTWAREFGTWWPERKCVVVGGTAGQRREAFDAIEKGEADVLVVHWEALRYHTRLAPYGSIALSDEEKTDKEFNFIPWVAVVGDEAHKLKNPQSKMTRAAWAIAHQKSVVYRFALTGTPIGNAPHDMWSILHFIDPREFGSKTRWVDRYCLVSFNAFGGLDVIGIKPETAEEFYSVVDPHMRRMPKKLVLPQLPPKIGGIENLENPNFRILDMSTKQQKAYEQMIDRMVAALDNEDVIITTNPIAQLTRLMQFASAYAEIVNDEVKLIAPSNKVDALMDLLDEMGDEPLVVFAQSKQLILLAAAELEKAKIPHTLLVGGQSDVERQRNIDDFQQGRVRVILCTVAAGGVGVTLTRARVLCFMQRDFSLINNKQAEDRVHRIGSEIHESVEIIDFISGGTVDERILNVLRGKGDKLEEIVRDKATLRALLVGDRAPKKGRRK